MMKNHSQNLQITGGLVANNLNHARKIEGFGQIKEAEAIYRQILAENGKLEIALFFLSLNLMKQDRFLEAEKILIKLKKINPKNVQYLLKLGYSLFKNNKIAESIKAFNQVLKIEKNNIEAMANIGNCYIRMQQYDFSIPWFQRVSKLTPKDSVAWYNLGVAFEKSGDFSGANESYKESLKLSPDGLEKVYRLCLSLFKSLNYKELKAFIEDQLQGNKLKENQKIGIKVIRANIAWLENNIEECKQYLPDIAEFDNNDHAFPNFDHLKTYCLYLHELLKYRNDNPSLYKKAAKQDIYIIGDSHCLSPAYSNIELNDESYCFKPLLIVGAQAAHLSKQHFNRSCSAFEKVIRSLPLHSKCILTFGEIDCRLNYGIYPKLKKKNKLSQKNVESDIYKIVKNYIEYTASICDEKAIRPAYCNIPASNDFKNMNNEEQEQIKFIIKKFNETMQDICTQKNFQIVDIYKQTSNSEGLTLTGCHLENCHVKPEIFLNSYKILRGSK